MRWLFLLLLLAAPALAVDTCVDCHAAQSAASLSRQTTMVAQDVHGRAGLSCHSCHGGDPAQEEPYDSMDEKKGYVGIPKPSQVAALCAKCHANPEFMRTHAPGLPTDQAAKFATSHHSRSAAKDEKGAVTCTACHRAHGILPSSDPRSTVHAANVPATCGKCHSDPARMGTCNLATDVVKQYTASVHWKAVKARPDRAAPVCHDCHGNHAAATPPPEAVVNVCGRCHTAERAAFTKGKHIKLKGFSGCMECHSNHRVDPPSDALLAPGGACVRCHQTPGPALDEARHAHAAFTGLDADIAAATAALEPLKAQALDVREAEDALSAARQALIAARRLIHTDDRPALAKQVQAGADEVTKARMATAGAHTARRNRRTCGLAFALFALFTSLTLLARVRELAGAAIADEAPEPAAPATPAGPAPAPAPRSKPAKPAKRKKGRRH